MTVTVENICRCRLSCVYPETWPLGETGNCSIQLKGPSKNKTEYFIALFILK